MTSALRRLAIQIGISLIKKGGNAMIMVDVYVALIVGGRRNITQVPVHLQADVLAALAALGLDGYGKPLPVEPPTDPTEPGADA